MEKGQVEERGRGETDRKEGKTKCDFFVAEKKEREKRGKSRETLKERMMTEREFAEGEVEEKKKKLLTHQ